MSRSKRQVSREKVVGAMDLVAIAYSRLELVAKCPAVQECPECSDDIDKALSALDTAQQEVY